MHEYKFQFGDFVRIVDKKLLKKISEKPCTICGSHGPNDPHHVTSRGAGGGDLPNNVMPLCHTHHVQWHQYGPGKMCNKYPEVRTWLEEMNRDDVLRKALV